VADAEGQHDLGEAPEQRQEAHPAEKFRRQIEAG
jgi:hypothetical protein